jgi:hypothetical protein
MKMAGIALWVKTEEALIAAKIPREKWQRCVNEAVMFALSKFEDFDRQIGHVTLIESGHGRDGGKRDE